MDKHTLLIQNMLAEVSISIISNIDTVKAFVFTPFIVTPYEICGMLVINVFEMIFIAQLIN